VHNSKTEKALLIEVRELIKDDMLQVRKKQNPMSGEKPKDVIGLLEQIDEKLDRILRKL